MADNTKDTEKAAAKEANTSPDNSATEFANGTDSSKADEVENKGEAKNDTTKHRSLKGVENDKDKVSGQNHPASVPSDERDFREQYAAHIREYEAEHLDPEHPAGEDYLYPDLPVSAQNPPKNVIIAYKTDPTGEANNS